MPALAPHEARVGRRVPQAPLRSSYILVFKGLRVATSWLPCCPEVEADQGLASGACVSSSSTLGVQAYVLPKRGAPSRYPCLGLPLARKLWEPRVAPIFSIGIPRFAASSRPEPTRLTAQQVGLWLGA